MDDKRLKQILQLNSLFDLPFQEGKFDLAIEICDKIISILEISENMDLEEKINYAITLSNKAECHIKLSNFDDAERLLLMALNIIDDAIGKTSLDYFKISMLLFKVYHNSNNIIKAEEQIEQLLEKFHFLSSNNIISESEKFFYYNDFGMYYYHIGQYEKAETFYLQVYNFYKNNTKDNRRLYATTLNNLASLYEEK